MSTKKKKFVVDWDKSLGWSKNPFEEEIPDPAESFYAGNEKERNKLNLFVIEKYRFGTIDGENGMGKTMTLLWLRGELKKYNNRFLPIYIDAEKLQKPQDFIVDIVSPLINIYEKKISKPHEKLNIASIVPFIEKKNEKKIIILLIDNADLLKQQSVLLLKHLHDSKLHLQIILAGTNIKKSEVSSIGETDHLKIKLDTPNYEEFEEMVSRRIKGANGVELFPFKHEQLKRLSKKAKNHREMLSICQDEAIEISLKKPKLPTKSKIIETEKSKMFEISTVSDDNLLSSESSSIPEMVFGTNEDMPESDVKANEDLIANLADELEKETKSRTKKN